MKRRNIILTIVAVIAGFVLLFGGAFYALMYRISHGLDCEAFTIDNVEVRTQTDIPDLAEDPVCTYNEEHKAKSNLFLIDKSVDMERYITRNHFTLIGATPVPQFIYRKDFNKHISKHPHPEQLFTKSGQYIGEESGNMDTWLYILDSASGEMWMEVLRTKHH